MHTLTLDNKPKRGSHEHFSSISIFVCRVPLSVEKTRVNALSTSDMTYPLFSEEKEGHSCPRRKIPLTRNALGSALTCFSWTLQHQDSVLQPNRGSSVPPEKPAEREREKLVILWHICTFLPHRMSMTLRERSHIFPHHWTNLRRHRGGPQLFQLFRRQKHTSVWERNLSLDLSVSLGKLSTVSLDGHICCVIKDQGHQIYLRVAEVENHLHTSLLDFSALMKGFEAPKIVRFMYQG